MQQKTKKTSFFIGRPQKWKNNVFLQQLPAIFLFLSLFYSIKEQNAIKKERRRSTFHKAGFTFRENQKEYEQFRSYSFSRALPCKVQCVILCISGGKRGEVFAIAKVKLLCSEVWTCIQVKLSLPTLPKAKLHYPQDNFTYAVNFTCPFGKLSWGTCFIAGAPNALFLTELVSRVLYDLSQQSSIFTANLFAVQAEIGSATMRISAGR